MTTFTGGKSPAREHARMMSRKQRYLTGILVAVILGTIVGTKAWTPERRSAAPQDARGGETATGSVHKTMPLAKPAR